MTTTISSVVLRARPDRLPRVRAALAAMPGLEIHADSGDGRLVLVIEDTETRSAADAFTRLHCIEGVLNASLVYQYCDHAYPQEPDA